MMYYYTDTCYNVRHNYRMCTQCYVKVDCKDGHIFRKNEQRKIHVTELGKLRTGNGIFFGKQKMEKSPENRKRNISGKTRSFGKIKCGNFSRVTRNLFYRKRISPI